jgi:hypothetical protein
MSYLYVDLAGELHIITLDNTASKQIADQHFGRNIS